MSDAAVEEISEQLSDLSEKAADLSTQITEQVAPAVADSVSETVSNASSELSDAASTLEGTSGGHGVMRKLVIGTVIVGGAAFVAKKIAERRAHAWKVEDDVWSQPLPRQQAADSPETESAPVVEPDESPQGF